MSGSTRFQNPEKPEARPPCGRPSLCSALDQLRRVNLGSIYIFFLLSFATAAVSFLTIAIRSVT